MPSPYLNLAETLMRAQARQAFEAQGPECPRLVNYGTLVRCKGTRYRYVHLGHEGGTWRLSAVCEACLGRVVFEVPNSHEPALDAVLAAHRKAVE